MTKPLLLIFAFATLGRGPLFGQTFTGTWQGQLNAPAGRVVIKISTLGVDQLAAEFYSADRSAQPVSASSVTVSGWNLKIVATRLNGTYEGKLNADGKTIIGTWIQQTPTALTLTRATPETAWTIPDPPSIPKMMDPNANPEFEVATIKPSDPNRPGWTLVTTRSGTLNTLNTTLSDLVKFAYDIHPKQIVGAPAWFDLDRFDILARPDTPGVPNDRQMQMMLRKLLNDRFSLEFHKDERELAVYAVTVAKDGAKIKREDNANTPGPAFSGQPQSGFSIRNATMAEFASMAQAQFLDQPVVDETGLGDVRYTFTLKFTPDSAMPRATVDPDAPPDFFSAVAQQLGLRVQKAKARVDVMIIDRVEKPSAN